MMDVELEGMVEKATAAYRALTPEQRYNHDRGQAISFAYGNCKLDGSAVTVEQVAATWDKTHYPFGLSMWAAGHEEWCIAASAEDAAQCYEEMAGESLEKQCGEPIEWTEEPPGDLFMFTNGYTVIVKTNAEWCRERGRGHFARANI